VLNAIVRNPPVVASETFPDDRATSVHASFEATVYRPNRNNDPPTWAVSSATIKLLTVNDRSATNAVPLQFPAPGAATALVASSRNGCTHCEPPMDNGVPITQPVVVADPVSFTHSVAPGPPVVLE
jgi:hypothetical protein